MPPILVHLRTYLELTLQAGVVMLTIVFVSLFVARLAEMRRTRRTRRVEERYRPTVAALCDGGASPATLDTLKRVPRCHQVIVGRLILNALRLTSGDVVDSLRAGAAALGVDRVWRRGIQSRRWWERAESATALGLARIPDAGAALVGLLDDPHEQVRAAAVTALGWLADESTIVPLLARLADETRHQRVRVVEAFQHFGPEVGPPLAAYAIAHPDVMPLIAGVLGELRVVAAVDQLIDWTSHADPAVRVAALRALGTIGLDDRGFYYVVRALGDHQPDARAMAARALGMAGRVDAASYLEAALDDEWVVAAQAAIALRRLGASGRAVLERAAERDGQAADLARQMLWESLPAIGAAA